MSRLTCLNSLTNQLFQSKANNSFKHKEWKKINKEITINMYTVDPIEIVQWDFENQLESGGPIMSKKFKIPLELDASFKDSV